mmetsp:Transcript_29942/g.36712  ORF Transcript_29942/g.36712 Transcript_29942/m.36712 type:complete len:428 (-) Transcript_29942:30-1313(-)
MKSKVLSKIDTLLSKIDTMTSESKANTSLNDDKLLMIPGPTEFDERVYVTLSQKTMSHVDPRFIKQFGNCLNLVRKVLLGTNDTYPFILSGGGSIGWDAIACSLCFNNDKALVLNTGYFSDNFTKCLESYGISVDEINANVGDTININSLKNKLTNNTYKIVCITHVDTSTGVCNDIAKISKIIKDNSPNTLIAVDGVCSFAAERFYFDKWGIDVCMTASQKAFGVPPGLAILLVSKRGMDIINNNKNNIKSWYCNLARWAPIMSAYEAGKVAYFSTPNVNLIQALEVSLKLLLDEGIENVFKRQYKYAYAFKESMKALGLGFVPISDKLQANTLTCVRYPKNVNPTKFRVYCKEKGCIFAGGLHKKIKNEYFRVGHMGISTKNTRNDLLKCVKAIQYALYKCNITSNINNIGVNTFNKSLNEYSKL